MTTTNRSEGVRSLVDMEKGVISRDVFVSEELYKQELEQVFARTWLFVGHTSQIPTPNDYFISRMGEESVILTRDRQGKVHVLLNTCMHRGMKVCRYDEGNTPVFSCPYHGWSFSTDGNLVSVPGELIGVPQFATAYHGELKKEEWGLVSVPKMHIYKGSVWACWDKNAPDWEEYMEGLLPYMDLLLEGTDGDPEGRIMIPGVHKWLAPHNWKFGAENFIGDGYHASTTHRSAILAGGSGLTGAIDKGHLPSVMMGASARNISISFPQGHGVLRSLHPDDWANTDSLTIEDHPDAEVAEYFRSAYEARLRNKGSYGPQRSGGNPTTVFPNMSWGAGATSYTIAVWHPAGAWQTETWRWYLVDKNAPAAVRNAWRMEQIKFSGPVGMTEKDDMENWGYATEASKGTMAHRYPYHFGQGMGHETRHVAFPGASVDDAGLPSRGRYIASEQNQRGFYKRWAEVMDARDWDELRRWDRAVGK